MALESSTVNTIVNAVLGAVIAGVGVWIRGLFREMTRFFASIREDRERLETVEEVVDDHSIVLQKAGWVKTAFPELSKDRRSSRERRSHER